MNRFTKTIKLYENKIWYNILVITILLTLATIISFAYMQANSSHSANIALFYILALILISRYTNGYIYSFTSAIICVMCVNFLFTEPFFKFNFTLAGYPVTFIVMFAINSITATLSTNLKKQGILILEAEKKLHESEKEHMRATLLRSISHDLRTPLTSIMCISDNLINSELQNNPEHTKKQLNIIKEDSNWLLHMIENLLSVTRISDTNTLINQNDEMAEEILSAAINQIRTRLPNTLINVSIPDEILIVSGDAMLLKQALINITENALNHSMTKKPIECHISSTKDFVLFHVRDYGIGLPKDVYDYLNNNSGYTSYTYSDSHRGSGIGLSICKAIANAHNGHITAIAHPDGTEIILSIPYNQIER